MQAVAHFFSLFSTYSSNLLWNFRTAILLRRKFNRYERKIRSLLSRNSFFLLVRDRVADARKRSRLYAARKSLLRAREREKQPAFFIRWKAASGLFPWHGIQTAQTFSFCGPRSDNSGLSLSFSSFSSFSVALVARAPLSSRLLSSSSSTSSPPHLDRDALLRGFIYVFSAGYECPRVVARALARILILFRGSRKESFS